LLNEFLKEHRKNEQQRIEDRGAGSENARQEKQMKRFTAGLQKVSATARIE